MPVESPILTTQIYGLPEGSLILTFPKWTSQIHRIRDTDGRSDSDYPNVRNQPEGSLILTIEMCGSPIRLPSQNWIRDPDISLVCIRDTDGLRS